MTISRRSFGLAAGLLAATGALGPLSAGQAAATARPRAGSAEAPPAKATPVARWRLDAATGSPTVTPDEWPGHLDARLGGGATINPSGGPLLVPGTLALDGIDGHAEAPVAVDTTGSFSLALWASPIATPTRDMTVLALTGKRGSALTLRWKHRAATGTASSVGHWEAEIRDSARPDAARSIATHTPAVPLFEQWNHLAVVYDADAAALKLYVNGAPENQQCAPGDEFCFPSVSIVPSVRPFGKLNALQFGRSRSGQEWTDHFAGELDDAWLYRGALSESQIIQLADYNTMFDQNNAP
ncbi:LamG-like jellyroll fold domain-containing protein [Kitasatospora sp. NPDC048365]|uniref:LamG-like jellyroll fold domain-containing protein n=1 Tax=Kitasatospora sp. NPDC048365 TaxID=3364050 RepID=UPI00371CA4F2